jgi:hypothetical protein
MTKENQSQFFIVAIAAAAIWYFTRKKTTAGEPEFSLDQGSYGVANPNASSITDLSAIPASIFNSAGSVQPSQQAAGKPSFIGPFEVIYDNRQVAGKKVDIGKFKTC